MRARRPGPPGRRRRRRRARRGRRDRVGPDVARQAVGRVGGILRARVHDERRDPTGRGPAGIGRDLRARRQRLHQPRPRDTALPASARCSRAYPSADSELTACRCRRRSPRRRRTASRATGRPPCPPRRTAARSRARRCGRRPAGSPATARRGTPRGPGRRRSASPRRPVDEALQRRLDAEAHHLPEQALHRPLVGRDLAADGGDHLVGNLRQHRPEDVVAFVTKLQIASPSSDNSPPLMRRRLHEHVPLPPRPQPRRRHAPVRRPHRRRRRAVGHGLGRLV